jgi:hypothetical protein
MDILCKLGFHKWYKKHKIFLNKKYKICKKCFKTKRVNNV